MQSRLQTIAHRSEQQYILHFFHESITSSQRLSNMCEMTVIVSGKNNSEFISIVQLDQTHLNEVSSKF